MNSQVYDGLTGEYELQDEKFHTMEVLIIAFDRECMLIYQAQNKTDLINILQCTTQ